MFFVVMVHQGGNQYGESQVVARVM